MKKKFIFFASLLTLATFLTGCGTELANHVGSTTKQHVSQKVNFYQIPLKIVSIQMLNSHTGWALAYQTPDQWDILYTRNSGSNWIERNVPSSLMPLSEIENSAGAYTPFNRGERPTHGYSFLVAKDTAWLGTIQNSTMVITHFTMNRKNTISFSDTMRKLPKENGFQNLSLSVTKNHMFALVSTPLLSGSYKALYTSSIMNLGKWEMISSTMYPSLKLPMSCFVNGISFINNKEGFLAMTYTGQWTSTKIPLLVTRDYGNKWSDAISGNNSPASANHHYVNSGVPVFGGKNRRQGTMFIEIVGSSNQVSIGQSYDYGQNWTFGSPRVLDIATSLQAIPYDQVNPQTLFIEGSQPNVLYRTTNSGQSWSTLHANINLRNAPLNFVNANIGWIAIRGVLYQTDDGGRFWISKTMRVKP